MTPSPPLSLNGVRRIVPFAAVIFDFDGTLAELTIDFPLMQRRLRALAANYLEEDAVAAVPAMATLELAAALTHAVAQALDPDTGREFNTRARFVITDMELAAARAGNLFPFARPLLAELRERGHRIGVVTRNTAASMAIVYPDLASAADVVLAREDVARVKPDPGHVLDALDRLGVAPADALMVGDHPIDVACAHAAGCAAGAVTSGHLGAEVFAALGANGDGTRPPEFIAPDARRLCDDLREAGLL